MNDIEGEFFGVNFISVANPSRATVGHTTTGVTVIITDGAGEKRVWDYNIVDGVIDFEETTND